MNMNMTAEADVPRTYQDFMDLGYPVRWSRYQEILHGQPMPPRSEHPLDFAAPAGTPDGNYTVADGQGRSIDHKAIVESGLLDPGPTVQACYEAIWRAHGLTPQFPPQPEGPVVTHIFVEEMVFDHHEGVLRIFSGS